MIVGGSIAWCNFNHVQGEWNEFLDVVQHKQHELVHIRAAIGIVHTAGIADITVKGIVLPIREVTILFSSNL